MRSFRRYVRALLATVALLLRPDAAAVGCPLAELTADPQQRVETAQLSGAASVWSGRGRDIEFRLNDNDDPSLPPSVRAARFRAGLNPQRPRSRRCATTFRHRTRVPRGPPLLLSWPPRSPIVSCRLLTCPPAAVRR